LCGFVGRLELEMALGSLEIGIASLRPLLVQLESIGGTFVEVGGLLQFHLRIAQEA